MQHNFIYREFEQLKLLVQINCTYKLTDLSNFVKSIWYGTNKPFSLLLFHHQNIKIYFFMFLFPQR